MSASAKKEMSVLEKQEGFKLGKVKDLISIRNGYAFKSNDFRDDDGIPVIRQTNLSTDTVNFDRPKFLPKEFLDIHNQFVVRKGDVLIGLSGSIGNLSTYREDFLSLQNQRTGLLVEKVPGSRRYVEYFLKSIKNQLNEVAKGVAVQNISSKQIEEWPIPIATPEQQKQIVAKIEELFSHIDAGIDALKQSKQLLKQYRQSVLKAAVTGELSKEWREQNKDKLEPASKLLERILQERRQKWEAQQMEQFKAKGKMPKDEGWKERYEEAVDCEQNPAIIDTWVKCRLDTISDAVGGYAFKSSDFTEEGHQIVKMANIKMDILDLENRPSYIENVPEEIIEKYKIVNGDILVTLTGTRNKRDYGYIVLVGKNDKSLLLNQRIARLRPYVSKMSRFLSICLQGKEFRDSFFSYETGNVGQGNVGMRAITEVTINLPPLEEQLEIVRQYDEKITASLRLEHDVDVQLIKAERQKQSILQSAFGGLLSGGL